MAADLADRPNLTLNGFVELMLERLTEQPEEAESALSEDTLDAVRVLTIHKAKGSGVPAGDSGRVTPWRWRGTWSCATAYLA
jgi:ATP-dependent helicase/nuclease subunit A